MDEERFKRDRPGQPAAADLRHAVADALLDRIDIIINDSVALFPLSGPQPLDAEFCGPLGQLLLQLLAMAVREGRLDFRSSFVADLHRAASERSLAVDRLFAFVYLTERTALDELALSDSIGATADPWPLVAQLVRRGSFDLLAAYTERLRSEPTAAAVTDRLTTLYARPLLEAAVATELERTARFGRPIAFILFDVDLLSDINRTYGYGVGDRILERMGILMRKYFRQHDWVARHGEDSIAVLMPDTAPDAAMSLAEHAVGMVEKRLGFRDHRTETRVRVTVSAAVVIIEGAVGEPVDGERLMLEAETALERAKSSGRNRVERVDLAPSSLTLAVAARYLNVSPTTIRRMVADGSLSADASGTGLRIDRKTLDRYRTAAGSRQQTAGSAKRT